MAAEDVGHLTPERDECSTGEVEGGDDPVEFGDLVEVGGDEWQCAGDDGHIESLEGEWGQKACDELESIDQCLVALGLALRAWLCVDIRSLDRFAILQSSPLVDTESLWLV